MPIKAIVLPFFALAFAAMFAEFHRALIRRWPTKDTWTRFLLAETGLLLVLIVTPNWVTAMVSLTCAVLMFGVWMLCTVVRVVARVQLRRGRARARKRLLDDPAQLIPAVDPLDEWLVEEANEVMTKGFRQAEQGVDSDGQTIVVLFRDDDSIVAEVVMPPANDPRLVPGVGIVELTSVLEGHRGALCTSSAMPAGPMPFWKGEIRQHFPGAPATTLIDEHERAILVLAERGILVERYPFERVHVERTWGLRRMAAAQASTSTRVVFKQLRRDIGQPRKGLGRLENDAALWERLRDLPEAHYSVPE